MTPYQLWQQRTYGNILPERKVWTCEPAASTSEIVYAYQLEEHK